MTTQIKALIITGAIVMVLSVIVAYQFGTTQPIQPKPIPPIPPIPTVIQPTEIPRNEPRQRKKEVETYINPGVAAKKRADEQAAKAAKNRAKVAATIENNINPHQEIRKNLKESEIKTPFQYIRFAVSGRLALLENQVVLSGEIKNLATLANYKDFVLELQFYSKSGTLVSKKNYTIYATIAPQRKRDFKGERVSIPNGLGKKRLGDVKCRLVNVTGF
jgi:hypothetical protein